MDSSCVGNELMFGEGGYLFYLELFWLLLIIHI